MARHRLALDHLTAVDCDPGRLVRAAHRAGCAGVGLFMQAMEVLPLMPRFDLVRDRAARRDLRRTMDDHAIALDIAYPFTLAGQTEIADFGPAMAGAAELGAFALNALVYDRDPARQLDRFGAFCDLAASHGHRVVLEFYPASRIGSLAAALDLVRAIDRPGRVGVNVDLLHLMRAGESVADLAAAPAEAILYAQLADGPAAPPPDPAREAASDRLLAGEGDFDLAGFVAALPRACRVSVELPRDRAVLDAVPCDERVALAIGGVRRALG